jgi:hypothetical protein
VGQFVQRGSEAPVWADDTDLDRMLTSGYQPVSTGDVGQAVTQLDRGQSGIGGAITAGVSSLASGATLGLSDAAIGALTPSGVRKDVAAAREAHPIVSTVGNIVGAVAPALLSGGSSLAAEAAEAAPAAIAGRLGGAVTESLGGGTLARIAGGAAEGGVFGAGQGVSDLALNDDPLTAENIVGSISSNALLGAGFGAGISGAARLAELGLERAGTAIRAVGEARSAAQALPADLQGLDDAGLKGALNDATVEHAKSVDAVTKSLEQDRVSQRADLAQDISQLHEDMRSSQIYQLTHDEFAGAPVEGIDGVKVAQRQLGKANTIVGNVKLDSIGLADNPTKVLSALQIQQSALQTLQSKMPELQAALVGKPAASVLDSVDGALQRTKAQIESIKALDSRANPVNSDRLMALKAGPSARMEQIATAREALKAGNELGVVGKGATAAAFAGGTALAHMIPGVGIAAPFVGKLASDAVGLMAKRLSGVASGAASRTGEAITTFLSGARKIPAAAIATPTAKAVLGSIRFGTEQPPADGVAVRASTSELGDLFHARADELKRQTMYAPDGSVQVRPEARQQIASTFDGVRQISPPLADKMETAAVRRVAFQSSKIPRKPDSTTPQFGPDNWRPSDLAIRSCARSWRASEDPDTVERRLAHGIMTPEEAEAYRACFPERFASLQNQIFAAAPTLQKTLPMRNKVALSIFTGIPVTPAMQPNVMQVLQATFAVEPGSAGGTQAPRPSPAFGKFGSLKDIDKPTPAQERQL